MEKLQVFFLLDFFEADLAVDLEEEDEEEELLEPSLSFFAPDL